MPRVTIQQTNFTAGEISPRLLGRTDIDRYGNACASILNAYPIRQGGAKRRPGTRFNSATKTSAKRSALIPYAFSRDVSYMLEFGDLYVRVYPKGGGALLVELVSPYTEAQVADIDWAQTEDVLFLFHPSVPIQRLRRFGDADWDLAAAPFTVAPFDEQGHALAANITLSLATVGTGRTATASAAVFLASDVGRQLISGKGVATVTGFTDTTHLTVDITIAFASVSLLSAAWYLDVSPQGFVKPSADNPIGTSVTLAGSITRNADITLSSNTGAGITVTASAAIFAGGDVGKTIYADAGQAKITVFTDATHVTADITPDFLTTFYPKGAYGITDNVWRAEDVGKYVRIDGGIAKVTTFTDATSVRATLITELDNHLAAPPFAWSLESAVWSAVNGYPRTGTLHEQRLVAGGTTKFPQTIWGSRVAEYLDFTKGANDDESYSYTIAADEVNPISHLTSLRHLVIHTYGGEFSARGGVEKPITPTSVRIVPETAHGSKAVRPVIIGNESIYVQRSGRKVRAMSYHYDADGYQSPDLAVLAEHITEGGIVGMAYQQEPESILWAWRGDGAFISCTLDREQQVTGWAHSYHDGAVESMATIPNGDRDEVWQIVRRVVNSASVRYLEILDDTFQPTAPAAADPNDFPPVASTPTYGYTVDCGQSTDSALGQTVFNVPHLIGKTVDILADGSVMPQQVVTGGGTVTLSRPAFRALIGLPFRTELELLTPELGTGEGTAQGNAMRTSEITLRLVDTIGGKLVGEDGHEQTIPFRRLGVGVLDQPPQPFTGLKRQTVLGWMRGSSVQRIVQDLPLPMHVLAVIRKFTVNSG